MEWSIIILISLVLLEVGWVLWYYFQGVRFATTQHTVHCPLHDHSATLTVDTKFQDRWSRRHVDVATCSLQHQEPVVLPERVMWVPDVPYSDLCFQKAKPTPTHIGGVTCRKDCLRILNLAEGHGAIGQKRCIFGVMDSPELAREAARNTASEPSTLHTPWTYI